MTSDGIPVAALQVLSVLIDELTSEIILKLEHRLEKFDALKYFIASLGPTASEEKALHIQVARILTSVTSWDPYDTTFEDCKPPAAESNNLLENVPPLQYWLPERWDALATLLNTVAKKLEQHDTANVFVAISLHHKLSRIRVHLERELATKSSGPANIDANLISQFVDDVKSTEDSEVRKYLETLLIVTNVKWMRSGIKEEVFTLKPIDDLKVTLRKAPFAFGYIQRELGKLIFQWTKTKMPSLKYLLEEQDEKSVSLPSPRVATSVATHEESEGCQQGQVDDEDNVKLANDNEVDHAMQRGRNRGSAQPPSQRRKSKPSQNNGEFMQDEVAVTGGVQILDDEEEMADKPCHETFASKRRKTAVRFTQAEKNAILEGVGRFGTGNWSHIRDMYDVLHHRKDSKTLKACYRIMLKNREVVEEDINETHGGRDTDDAPKRKRLTFHSPNKKKSMIRTPWTSVEKAAVYNGVQKYGEGVWKAIKEDANYASALENRTTAQIKDCYRVLKQNVMRQENISERRLAERNSGK